MGVPNSWGSRDSRDMGGRDQCGAVTRPWSPMKTSNWARSTKRTRGKNNGTSQIFVVSFIHAGMKHLSFHWELRDIHSRMMDCLQFSTRRLHEWDATWCWQDVIYIYCVVYTRYAQLYTHRHMTMFLVHTFCHYWMIRIAGVFFPNDLLSGAGCHSGPARFRSKVRPCRGSGRTKYRTPPFGGCWSAIWRNSWVIISFQT